MSYTASEVEDERDTISVNAVLNRIPRLSNKEGIRLAFSFG